MPFVGQPYHKNNSSFIIISYDLAKHLTTLTIITDFGENILNSGKATKQSENLFRAWFNIISESFFPEKVGDSSIPQPRILGDVLLPSDYVYWSYKRIRLAMNFSAG